jgi:hypothetical protein
VGFATLYWLFTRHMAAHESYMFSLYADMFPPLAEPSRLPGWILRAHTGLTFAYPIGGSHGGSALTLLAMVIATWWLFRRRITVAALCLTPLVLHLIAAALQKYPYGGSARFMLDLAAPICLLTGIGTAVFCSWLSAQRAGRLALCGYCVLLAAIGGFSLGRDLLQPYKHDYESGLRDFARWFWRHKAADAEIVCLHTDLARDFNGEQYQWSGSALYLCNQKIYSARHARGEPPHLPAVSAERPLRCILFNEIAFGRDEQQFQAWLSEMESRYDWVAYEKHDFHGSDKMRHGLCERIEVFDFVPRSAAHPETAGRILRAEPLLRR